MLFVDTRPTIANMARLSKETWRVSNTPRTLAVRGAAAAGPQPPLINIPQPATSRLNQIIVCSLLPQIILFSHEGKVNSIILSMLRY